MCIRDRSLSAATTVCEFKDGEYYDYTLTPEEMGLTRCKKDELVGGSPEVNAKITTDILKGATGPMRDTVLLNAAAGLYVAGKTASLKDGIVFAGEIIDSGAAYNKLEEFRKAAGE